MKKLRYHTASKPVIRIGRRESKRAVSLSQILNHRHLAILRSIRESVFRSRRVEFRLSVGRSHRQKWRRGMHAHRHLLSKARE